MAAKLSGGGGDRFNVEQNSDINVTPFVDVMLVLLIIFMVAAPLIATGVPLDLPHTNMLVQALGVSREIEPSVIAAGNAIKLESTFDNSFAQKAAAKYK